MDNQFLALEVSAWQELEPEGNLDLIDITQDDWGRARLHLTLCSEHVVLQCPVDYPNYQVTPPSSTMSFCLSQSVCLSVCLSV